MRARGEEFLEQPAVGVEHRLAAVEIGGGELRFLQQPAALVLAEQVGGLGRAHDEAAHVMHEGGIEHLVERHRADDGHAQRRHGGDHRKQRDDADMQAGGGGARPPGADQQHRLEGHQAQQDQHDGEIDQEQDRNRVVGRRDRRHAGEDQEAGDGAENRESDREGPNSRQQPALAAARFLLVEPFVCRLLHLALSLNPPSQLH